MQRVGLILHYSFQANVSLCGPAGCGCGRLVCDPKSNIWFQEFVVLLLLSKMHGFEEFRAIVIIKASP